MSTLQPREACLSLLLGCCDMPRLQPHGGQVLLHHKKMTIIRTDDIDDLLPCEYKDPWPPSDEEIEMLEWLEEQNELERSIPSIAEMNRGLK